MTLALTVAACAFLNRWAGGGWPGWPFRGRALYAAMLGIALVAWPVLGWQAALALGIGFGIWRSPAWGYTISLGRDTPGHRRGPSDFEAFCIALALGNVTVALGLRHAICAVPAFVALGVLAAWWAPMLLGPFAALATLAYVAGWRFKARLGDPLRTAEILVGALWGVVILAIGGV